MRRGMVDIDPSAPPVVREVGSEPSATEPDEAVARVLALAEAASHDVAAVGVVLPGVVDESIGVGAWSENLGWRDVAFGDLLRSRLDVPVAIGHDVRAWGAAERRWGAGRGLSDVAVVVIGTGISAALVVDGRPLVARGFAGEIGHLRVAGDEPCACGGTGCLEAVASAAGIVRAYNAALTSGDRRSRCRRRRTSRRAHRSRGLVNSDGPPRRRPGCTYDRRCPGGHRSGGRPRLGRRGAPVRSSAQPTHRSSALLAGPELLPAAFEGTGGSSGLPCSLRTSGGARMTVAEDLMVGTLAAHRAATSSADAPGIYSCARRTPGCLPPRCSRRARTALRC